MKRTRVTKDDAFVEVTPFIKIPDTFSFWLPRAPEEVDVIVSRSDLSFIQNLPEGDEMEMAYKLAYNMFKDTSLFSLVSAGHGDVLASDNPFNERDIWKVRDETLELRCTYL